MPHGTGDGLRLDEIDGVPVLWRDVEGPLHAHLVFGLGQAHETLPLHGITHLVEHLLLSGSGQAPHAYNGTTGTIFTSFVAAGEPDEVFAHLERICGNVTDLPLDRLDHERQVLKAEAAQRGGSPADALVSWRWGPSGFGLTAFEEFGAQSAAPDAVREWARHLSGDRAVLWMNKPPPSSLRLPLAPTAPALVQPPLVTPAVSPPGCFPLPTRGASFSVLGGRVPAAAPALWLLQHRLEQRLRHQLGLVYGVSSGMDLVAADVRLYLFHLDCLPENSLRVQEETCAVLMGLEAPATDLEWSTMTGHRTMAMQAPDHGRFLMQLETCAQDLLLGRELVDLDEWEARVAAVTREEAAAYLQEVLRTLVLGVADPAAVPRELGDPVPVFSRERVRGHVLEPSADHSDKRVRSALVGAQGASLVFEGGDTVSVETSALAGVLCFDDGSRHLLGLDGFHVRIDPDEWQRASKALAELDAHIDPSVRIHLESQKEPRHIRAAQKTAATSLWAYWTLLAFCVAVTALVLSEGELILTVVYGFATAAAAAPIIRVWRARQSLRREGGS